MDYNWHVQALFLSLYKSFSTVLSERLPDASRAGTLRELKSVPADAMAVDPEESSAMDLDNENGRPKNRFSPRDNYHLFFYDFLFNVMTFKSI